jgi:ABC-type branched-subunit amino acid transport system substrate-binding protein
MFRRRFAWRSAAVLGVAALALAACADDGDEPGGDTTDEQFSGTLSLGGVLPETGSLSPYGAGMVAGVDMAVEEINEAGGVWGSDVEVTHRDEGESSQADIVQSAADFMVSQGVHAIIGAASSTSTLNVLETLNSANIIVVSPSNTAPDFTEHEFGDFYFRTAPSDILQGSALAQEILADGHATIGILAMQNSYGEGLANHIESVYTEGGGQVVAKEFFDPEQAEYAAEAGTIRDANPDAVVLISYDQSRQIIPAMVGASIGPQDKQLYLVDGNRLDYSEDFDPGLMAGTKASQPGAEEQPTEFFERVEGFRADLPEQAYIPESYDATIIVALAAIAANTDDTTAIRDEMVGVTKDGENCTNFADCAQLLADGADIDYDGITGVISFTDNGDPGEATIGIFEYGEDNTFERISSVPATME